MITPAKARLPVCSRLCICRCVIAFAALHWTSALAGDAGAIIFVGQRDLQQVIDAAPSNAIIQCDPNRILTSAVPITIRKPITLAGLHARRHDTIRARLAETDARQPGGSGRLFYLAIPPSLYEETIIRLAESGIAPRIEQ